MEAMTIVADGLREISLEARPYPAHLLPQYGSALALFAAGFHGWNDCIHFVRKDMRCDCVDTDAEKLREMQVVYPQTWRFIAEDAWQFAEYHQGRTEWDVVSVDPFFGDAAERAWQSLYLWCGLARRLVTLTVASDTHLNVPEGWTASFFPRSSTAAWMVLRRA